jgi:hypothetical protein
MKQETLEEAAERYFKKVSPNICFHDAAKFGAKWQAERMYSEEEVFEIVAGILHTPTLRDGSWRDISKWFEQFKKK